MNNPLEKYVVVVDSLLSKTKEGKVPWELDSGRSISVDSKASTLKLRISSDENFEDVYTIDIFSHDGTHVDGFSDTTLSGMPLSDGTTSYYQKMAEIYAVGRRQATGADKAIDDFLRDLNDEKLGIPF